jgi:8-oxo-dGTP pyrophosphatase MutT (NUDIX family)
MPASYREEDRALTEHPESVLAEARVAVVVVCRCAARGLEFLVLHRGHSGPDFAGDWAWGPPAGAREPGESAAACAQRELFEETGLRLSLVACGAGNPVWPVYLAVAPPTAQIRLSEEHDAFNWLPLSDAVALTSPAPVREQLERAGVLATHAAAAGALGSRFGPEVEPPSA